MRNLAFGLWALLVVAACGPSTAEIKTARDAAYHGDPDQLLDLAVQATKDEHYQIADMNQGEQTFITVPRWYSPEGDLESAGAGDFVTLVDRSVQVSLIVQLSEIGANTFGFAVIPKTFQHLSGSPKPRELTPDDPNLPPFVHGRADALSLAIYQHAKAFAVPAPSGGG